MSSYPLSINSLPPESLVDIFHNCVGSKHREQESVRVPITISSVCRRWRDVSLSFGPLWAYLDCCLPGPHKWLIEVFETWLHRANVAPLNFTFKCRLMKDTPPEEHRIAERIILMLLSHHRHWGQVNFYWRFHSSPNFPVIKLTDMPMLTSLDITICLINNPIDECGSINLAQSSKLVYLQIQGPILVEIGNIPMQSAHLVQLFVKRLTSTQCLNVLEAAPNLKEFQAVFGHRYSLSKGVKNSIISHNLRILVLHAEDPIEPVISKLELPALERLQYRDGRLEDAGENLLAFVQRSSPPLTYLNIGGNCANEATLMHILPLLPLLQALDMNRCTISARLFALLSTQSNLLAISNASGTRDQIICPNLNFFNFSYYSVVGDVRECADALCTVLDSRWDVLTLWYGPRVSDEHELHSPFDAGDHERVYHHIRGGKPGLCAACSGLQYYWFWTSPLI